MGGLLRVRAPVVSKRAKVVLPSEKSMVAAMAGLDGCEQRGGLVLTMRSGEKMVWCGVLML